MTQTAKPHLRVYVDCSQMVNSFVVIAVGLPVVLQSDGDLTGSSAKCGG